jgi:hypothetical protein
MQQRILKVQTRRSESQAAYCLHPSNALKRLSSDKHQSSTLCRAVDSGSIVSTTIPYKYKCYGRFNVLDVRRQAMVLESVGS